MNRNRLIARGLTAAALFALVAAGCGDSSESSSTTTKAAAAGAQSSTTVATTASTTAPTTTASTTTAAASAAANLGKCPAGDIATGATKVDYTLESFKITGPTTAKAGKVGISTKNTGGTHELMIIKGAAAGQPKNANGTIDEAKLAANAIVFRTARIPANETCTGVADLAAGTYSLLCNIEFNNAGTIISHPQRGMLTDLVVS